MNKLKLYTRTGDRGMTSLYGGKRVEKYDLQVESYGTVDELNSSIGVMLSFFSVIPAKAGIHSFYTNIQNDLFLIGSHLSGAKVDLKIIDKRVTDMEKFIDDLDESLTPLSNFILPSGAKDASFSHLSRSICRRAERMVIKLSKSIEIDKKVIMYLNRLSDCLFQTARFLNKENRINDVIWKKD